MKKRRRPVALASDLGFIVLDGTARRGTDRNRWPASEYRRDPVRFCHEILGVDPWEAQVELLQLARDHKRVAIASGHKIGKDFGVACLALWFYCSFDDARVVMTAPTSRQVDSILWRELRKILAQSGVCLACKKSFEAARKVDPKTRPPKRPCKHSRMVDGEVHELARSGLKAVDFREIVGFTAKEPEGVAGVSGANLLYILDEASGIPDEIFEAIEGNRAGGARVVLISNPTRTEGEFFEAFHSKKDLYITRNISSETTPNAKTGRDVVPGLATKEWVDEKKQEWGEDSPLFRVRVQGEFALKEDGKIISIHAIETARNAWPDTKAEGRLQIGVDVAGPGGQGDESAFAAVRGLKAISLEVRRGLNEDGHLAIVLGTIVALAQPRDVAEKPVVVVDKSGSEGAKVFYRFVAYLQNRPPNDPTQPDFELIGIQAGDKAERQPQVFDQVRDELLEGARLWFNAGGAIPTDDKLDKDLHAYSWEPLTVSGKQKVTPKKELRKILGRSPDRGDALVLAVWPVRIYAPPSAATGPVKQAESIYEPPVEADPYAMPGDNSGGGFYEGGSH